MAIDPNKIDYDKMILLASGSDSSGSNDSRDPEAGAVPVLKTKQSKKLRGWQMILLVISIAAVLAGGYYLFNNYLLNYSMKKNSAVSYKRTEEENKVLERDGKRIDDISALSGVLEKYAGEHDGRYPVSSGIEKISDEWSAVYKALVQDIKPERSFSDPIPGKYYYGYRSDGETYDLTAVLENQKDTRCNMEGDLCIHRVHGGAFVTNVHTRPDTSYYINRKIGAKILPPPGGWSIDELGEEKMKIVIKPPEPDNAFSPSITIEFTATGGYSLNEFMKKRSEMLWKYVPDYKIIEKKNMKINGKTALYQEETFLIKAYGKITMMHMGVYSDAKIYDAYAIVLNSSIDRYKDMLKKSLMTFEAY